MRPERAINAVERARALVARNDFAGALDAWQLALEQNPQSLEVVAGLADTAFRLSLWDLAERFYAHLITRGIQDVATICAYAACLREQGRVDEGIVLLKPLIADSPTSPRLWEALGALLLAKGERDTACVFFDEALRLAPDDLNARFHRGCARIEMGELQAGLADVSDCARRFSDPSNRASAELTCAHAALALGDLTSGWQWYQARHRQGTAREVLYETGLPRWQSGDLPARLFVSAEQGLGDEILYASLLPDLGKSLAGIAVEPRLVPLFRRSFPQTTVVAHRTETRDGRVHRSYPDLDRTEFGAWALMGDFMASRRGAVSDFPGKPYLKPDQARIAHWRGYFAALGQRPTAGVLWKSLKSNLVRDQVFSPFEQWRRVLETPGIQFVNLQYGDVTAELAQAQAAGLDMHTPAGIDLKDDLDDLTALCCALDLVMGPSNATTNLAAACGAKVWMISPPQPWLALGQSNYPWYGSVRLFPAQAPDAWSGVMDDVAAALTKHVGATNAL